MATLTSGRKRTCPQCQQAFVTSDDNLRWRPFCCERCKLVDLGGWLDESHRISTDDDGLPLDPDGFSDTVH